MPMLDQRLDLHYRLHFTSAFHFGTGLRKGLVHRSIARRRDGLPFVPGSTFKGVLRDQATQIARLLAVSVRAPHPEGEDDVGEFGPATDPVAAIFGSRVRPGTLSFDDAELCADDQELLRVGSEGRTRLLLSPVETRTQVSMSRRLGTAGRGLLFTSEYGLASLRFDGRLTGRLVGVPQDSNPAHSYELALLLAALHSLERLGGNTSVGAGQVWCEIVALQLDGVSQTPEAITAGLDGLIELEYYELSRDEPKGGS